MSFPDGQEFFTFLGTLKLEFEPKHTISRQDHILNQKVEHIN